MKKDLIIFGSKSAAIVVLTEILQLKTFNVIGFVDDYVEADQPVFKWKAKHISLWVARNTFLSIKLMSLIRET